MNSHFVKSPQKRDILAELEKNFGVQELPYLFIETSNGEKIRAFSGSLSKDEIEDLGKILHVELVGMYFLKKEQQYRLSFDALHLLKEQIVKSIIELKDEEYLPWMRGNDIPTSATSGIHAVRYNGIFLGCAKSNGSMLFNHIPKERRLRK